MKCTCGWLSFSCTWPQGSPHSTSSRLVASIQAETFSQPEVHSLHLITISRHTPELLSSKKKKQQLSSFYSRPSALLWNTLHSMCIHVYIHTCIYMYTYIRKYLLHNFTLSFFVALALASSHTVSITAKYALRRHCNCSHSKSTARVIGSLHAATQPLLLHPLVNGWTWLVQTCSNQKKREERAGNHRRDYVKWNCQRREAINHISPCSHCLWQLRQDSRQ